MTYEESVKRWENMVKLREQGATMQEVGNMYGITRQAVEQRLKKGKPKPKIAEAPYTVLGLLGYGDLEGRERARMLVRIRDNFTCQDCGFRRTTEEVKKYNSTMNSAKGKIKSLDVHHTHGMCGKNSRGYDSEKMVPKMITLCHKCHYNRPEHRMKAGAPERAAMREAAKNEALIELGKKVETLKDFGISYTDIAFNLGVSKTEAERAYKLYQNHHASHTRIED